MYMYEYVQEVCVCMSMYVYDYVYVCVCVYLYEAYTSNITECPRCTRRNILPVYHIYIPIGIRNRYLSDRWFVIVYAGGSGALTRLPDTISLPD